MTVQQIQLTHTGAAIKVRNFQNFAHGVGENNIKDAALAAGVFFEVLRSQNTRSSLKAFANYLNISTVKAEKHLYERAKKKNRINRRNVQRSLVKEPKKEHGALTLKCV